MTQRLMANATARQISAAHHLPGRIGCAGLEQRAGR